MKTVESKFSTQSIIEAVEQIQKRIEEQNYPSNQELIEICAGQNIKLIDIKSEPHLIHEILETAVNQHLSQTFFADSIKKENRFEILTKLENLTKNLPTQS